MSMRPDHLFGALLRKIVQNHESPTIREVGDHRGHFVVDECRYLLAKYRSDTDPPWRFTVTRDEVRYLRYDRLYSYSTQSCPLLVLLCGDRKICALRREEWSTLLDESPKGPEQQVITVSHEPGHQMGVWSGDRELDRRIPAARFPDILFA